MKHALLLASLLSLTLSGCATLSGQGDQTARLEKRVAEQMDAFVANDHDKAYRYMTPGFRDKYSVAGFSAQFAGMYDLQSYEILRSECEQERCTVSVNRMQKLPAYVALSAHAEPFTYPMLTKQTWLLIKGKWYHYKK